MNKNNKAGCIQEEQEEDSIKDKSINTVIVNNENHNDFSKSNFCYVFLKNYMLLIIS